MKILLAAIAPITLLAACSGGEKAEAPAADETVPAAMAVEPVTDGGYLVTAGTYEATMADGTAVKNVLNNDGTYSRTAGTMTETGKWMNEQGKTCLDPDGDDPAQPTRCSLIASPDADGSIRATGDDGVTSVWTKSS